MKLSDAQLRAILGSESHHLPEGEESWSDMWQSLAEDMARELLAARKVVEAGRELREDGYEGDYDFQWCVDLDDWEDFTSKLDAYDKATEGE